MQPVSLTNRSEHLGLLPRDVLDRFLAEARARGLGTRTCEEYRRLVARYLSEFRSLSITGLHDFVFGRGPSGRPPSPATAAVRRAAMASFIGFLVRRGYTARNLALDLPRVRSRQALPRGLSTDEIHRLLAIIPDTPPGRRDRAIIITALLTGLRRTELLSLTTEDIFWGDIPTITVRVKGGERRVRELPQPALAAIAVVQSVSGSGRWETPGRLFHVSAAGFAANLRRYGSAAGLGNVTPHVLRHTAAKLRRAAGASLEDVSGFLGHASIATTAVYLRRLEGWRDDQWRDISRLLALPYSQFLPGMEARAGPIHKWPSERVNAHSADWQGGPASGTTLRLRTLSAPPRRRAKAPGAAA